MCQDAKVRTLLDRGIAAARGGRRERARFCFEEVLALDADNEDAWLWLAAMTEDRDLARAIYERVLAAHPESIRAQDALRWLDEAAKRPGRSGTAEADDYEKTSALGPSQGEEKETDSERVEIGPAEEATEGPAIFIPPWEPDATIPVPGRSQDSRPLVPLTDEGALMSDDSPETGERQAEPTEIEQPMGSETTDLAASEKAPLSEAITSATPAESVPGLPDEEETLLPEAVPDSPVMEIKESAMDVGSSQAEMPKATEELPAHGPPEHFEPLPSPGPLGLIRLPRKRLLFDGAMLFMLGFVLLGSLVVVFLVGSTSHADRLRVALRVVTETPTPTCTLTPTRSPTPSPTSTPTPTYTLTPTPSPTLSPTVTITPQPTPTPAWITQRYLPLPIDEKWIEINLTEQSLTAYEGTKVVHTARISSGRRYTPTLEGKFRIKRKIESQLMTGPGYYLPGVPHVMYFYAGYALHGAYWHDKWGTPTSHGCVNLKREDAKWLYNWVDPKVPAGAKSVQATKDNPGTWVLVHK